MPYEHKIASLFRMTEETWSRHASPWSVLTRVATFPVVLAAVWSRAWLGWWALLPMAAVVIWLWLNPRLFRPPARTDNWASKATFGERVWLNRASIPIPAHHGKAATVLSALSGAGFVVAVAGASMLEPASTISGGAVCMLAKIWFCDRMVYPNPFRHSQSPRAAPARRHVPHPPVKQRLPLRAPPSTRTANPETCRSAGAPHSGHFATSSSVALLNSSNLAPHLGHSYS
jgi:hypothetical protein